MFTNKRYGVAQQLIVVSKPPPDKIVKFPKLKITELCGPLFKLNFVGACVAADLDLQRHVLDDIGYILPFWGILLAKTVILVVYALMEFLRFAAMLMFHRNPLGRPPEVWI